LVRLVKVLPDLVWKDLLVDIFSPNQAGHILTKRIW